jgi:hypothetical protein
LLICFINQLNQFFDSAFYLIAELPVNSF